MSVFCVYLPELCRGLFFLYMLIHVHTFACNVRRREWKDGVTSTSMCANLRCILFLITIDYAFLSNLLLTSFQHKSRCWFIIYSVYRILWTMIADIKCWLRKKKTKYVALREHTLSFVVDINWFRRYRLELRYTVRAILILHIHVQRTYYM